MYSPAQNLSSSSSSGLIYRWRLTPSEVVMLVRARWLCVRGFMALTNCGPSWRLRVESGTLTGGVAAACINESWSGVSIRSLASMNAKRFSKGSCTDKPGVDKHFRGFKLLWTSENGDWSVTSSLAHRRACFRERDEEIKRETFVTLPEETRPRSLTGFDAKLNICSRRIREPVVSRFRACKLTHNNSKENFVNFEVLAEGFIGRCRRRAIMNGTWFPNRLRRLYVQAKVCQENARDYLVTAFKAWQRLQVCAPIRKLVLNRA